MSARYALEKGELDVPAPDSPAEAGSAERPAEHPDSPPLAEPRSRGEVYAESRQRADGDWTPDRFEAPREELARFNPERAGLPAMSPDAVDEYIERNRAVRPWLMATGTAAPEARRIIAAMDSGGGHGHIRHEGWVSEEANMRRVTHREDPAQLDPVKRTASIDGLRPDDQLHRCGDTATRITNPDAFAAAFARGIEHPKVREALNTAFDPGSRPREVVVPIADLLGPDGYQQCTGWRLEPPGESMDDARVSRNAWVKATVEGRTPDFPEPRAVPVPTFEGGGVVFAFARNYSGERYEVVTMFPRPVVENQPRID